MVRALFAAVLILTVLGCQGDRGTEYGADIGVKVDGTTRLVDVDKATNFTAIYDLYTLPAKNYIILQLSQTYYSTVEAGSWVKIESAWDNKVRISYCLKGSEYGSLVVTYQNLQETLAKEPDKWSTDAN